MAERKRGQGGRFVKGEGEGGNDPAEPSNGGGRGTTIVIEAPPTSSTPPVDASPGAYVAPDLGDGIAPPLFADAADTDAIAYLRVRRTNPKNPPMGGAIGEFPPSATEADLRQCSGGGTYAIDAMTSVGRRLGTTVVLLAGQPRIPRDPFEDRRDDRRGGGASTLELGTLFEKIIGMHEASAAAGLKAANDAHEKREQDHRHYMERMDKSGERMITAISTVFSKSSETVITAVTQMSAGVMELAKAQIQAKGSNTPLGEMSQMAKILGELKGEGGSDMSPWMFAAMLAPSYFPPPGSPGWFVKNGKPIPKQLAAMMGAGGGGNPMAAGLAALAAGGAEKTNTDANKDVLGTDRADRETGESTDDPIASFLDYVGETPVDALPTVIAARVSAGTIPQRVVTVLDAFSKTGDPAELEELLEEYESKDLLPRIVATIQAMAAMAAGTEAAPNA